MEVTAEAYNNLEPKKKEYKFEPVWCNIIVIGAVGHVGILYGLLLLPTTKVATLAFAAAVLYPMSFLGITAGAHRLWAHKSYKASIPLRVLLVMFNSMALQKSVLWWCRDHRSHHKYTDTEADPHNINNGFFFAHIGWLLRKKHPEVALKGRSIDMSDLERDPILTFQEKLPATPPASSASPASLPQDRLRFCTARPRLRFSTAQLGSTLCLVRSRRATNNTAPTALLYVPRQSKNNKNMADLFNQIGAVYPFISAKEIRVGMVFIPHRMGKCNTRHGPKLYVDCDFKGEMRRLLLPERYHAFPDESVARINEQISENRPPKITATKRCGDGFVFDMVDCPAM